MTMPWYVQITNYNIENLVNSISLGPRILIIKLLYFKERKMATGEECTHSFYSLMKELEGEQSTCKTHRKDSIGEEAVKALPILFPFVIEFALIGASVFLLMSFYIGRYIS